MELLLTPKQVAELLSLSVRTVYDHSIRLGGFYPAGIKALRFRRDVIEAISRLDLTLS
ncbi:MAG: helix-turn-helix domain-containing protein [bacterium]|nr:helix-turn-helix domain-containing protein [bacterium]